MNNLVGEDEALAELLSLFLYMLEREIVGRMGKKPVH
jgi:hypothetical protein